MLDTLITRLPPCDSEIQVGFDDERELSSSMGNLDEEAALRFYEYLLT